MNAKYNLYKPELIQLINGDHNPTLEYAVTWVMHHQAETYDQAIEIGVSVAREVNRKGKITIDLEHGAQGVTRVNLTNTAEFQVQIAGFKFQFPVVVIRSSKNPPAFRQNYTLTNPIYVLANVAESLA